MTTVAVVDDGARSAVSWPAIFAGGVAAAAISLLLAALGAVLGLSAVSPWETEGASARLVSWGAGVYLVATAVIASALGGATGAVTDADTVNLGRPVWGEGQR